MADSGLLLTFCVVYNLGFAIFHILFWRIFNWKKDLASLTHVNRSVMQILNLRLIYVFLVMAFVLLAFQNELTATKLGHALLISFSIFWFMRTVEQVIFFGVRNRISLAMTVLFLLGGVIHLLPLIS